MQPVVLDFESLYTDDYTLSKMTTESYIRDPRFEAHGAAIKWSPRHNAKWYPEPELRYVLAEHDWSDTFLLCWHFQFDGLILNHHYNVRPRMAGCPMSMARLLLGSHIGVSLDSVRKQYDLKPKTTPYGLFKGLHWSEMPASTQELVADGCCDEVESIWKLFCIFAKDFPVEEYEVLDTVLRMFTEPMLRADVDLLATIWEREAAGKEKRTRELGIDESELRSADKFIALLEAEGVEVEYKNGKHELIPAISKSDDFMLSLLEDQNDRVRGLAEARIGAKSTLMQTRAETMGWMAQRRSGFTDGKIPFYLRYSGAGTLRPSGGDKFNALNFKRNSDLRRSILAPEGYLLAPIDASQIEFRVAHYLAYGADAPPLQQLKNGEDPYSDLASLFYGERIYKPKPGDPRQAEMEAKRGCGKQGHLMCIYGAAAPKYKATAKAGLYGPSVDLTIEEAERHVSICRDQMPWMCNRKTGYWAQAETMLKHLANGTEVPWGPLLIKDHRLWLPNGCAILYTTLEWHYPDETEDCRDFERAGYWRMKTRHGWKKMWGSKLVQNVCEAVSRVIVSQAMIRITRMGYRVLNWPYDELLIPIPAEGGRAQQEWHVERCMTEMKREVPWLPGLPLDCESHLSERYAK